MNYFSDLLFRNSSSILGLDTKNARALKDKLDLLRSQFPVAGVVHVGAGDGSVISQYAEWDVANVVFIEAEAGLYDKLAATIQAHPGWKAHKALVSNQEGEKSFYLASNPNESSVLPPENMNFIWPNLRTQEQRSLSATTLEALLKAADSTPETINWAVIDCLPGLPVLQGAGTQLEGWDVIVARALLEGQQLPDSGATKAELDIFLEARGYRCVAWEEGRQPAIATVIYVRDWKALFYSILCKLGQQITQLTKVCNEQTAFASECQRIGLQHCNGCKEQTDCMQDGKKLIACLIQIEREIARLTNSCDEQTKIVQKITLERDEQTKTVQKITQERDEQTKTVQKITQERDEQTKLVSELKAELTQARQTANLTAKLHTLREADLEDLQARYKEAVNMQERQHQLMLQLEGKLRVAAQYFHQLQNNAASPAAIAAEATPPAKPVRRRAITKQKNEETGKP